MTAMVNEEQEYPLGESPEYQAEKRAEVESAFGVPVKENPQPSAPKEPYALSESWSRGREYKKPFDYVISTSGQTVKIRRLDMGDMLRLGIAEEMDFMTKALMSNEKTETGGEAVASAVMKSDNFDRMDKMINKVVLAGLLAPKPHHPPLKDNGEVDEEAKKDGILYIDEIPFGDRMEMFSVIFESDGLATFRGEQTASVGDVETVPSVSLPAD
jgi:hypothetical protein